MSNLFFNFELPEFMEKYGEDWDNFTDEMETQWDHTFQKTWELYHLMDINKVSARVLQFHLDAGGVTFSETDTVALKKYKLRTWVTRHKKKGLDEVYLDLAEEVTGITGVLYSGIDFVFRWGVNRWKGSTLSVDLFRWSGPNPQFQIYFDVKTVDAGELDQIENLLLEDTMLPAFYQIFLIDSSFNILRTIIKT